MLEKDWELSLSSYLLISCSVSVKSEGDLARGAALLTSPNVLLLTSLSLATPAAGRAAEGVENTEGVEDAERVENTEGVEEV